MHCNNPELYPSATGQHAGQPRYGHLIGNRWIDSNGTPLPVVAPARRTAPCWMRPCRRCPAGLLTYAEAVDRLTEAQTAYGAINSVHDLISHPQLRTREMKVGGRSVQVPASPFATEWDDPVFRPLPGIDQHGELPVPARVADYVNGIFG